MNILSLQYNDLNYSLVGWDAGQIVHFISSVFEYMGIAYICKSFAKIRWNDFKIGETSILSYICFFLSFYQKKNIPFKMFGLIRCYWPVDIFGILTVCKFIKISAQTKSHAMVFINRVPNVKIDGKSIKQTNTNYF